MPKKRFQETSLEYVFRPDAMRSKDAAASKVALDLESHFIAATDLMWLVIRWAEAALLQVRMRVVELVLAWCRDGVRRETRRAAS